MHDAYVRAARKESMRLRRFMDSAVVNTHAQRVRWSHARGVPRSICSVSTYNERLQQFNTRRATRQRGRKRGRLRMAVCFRIFVPVLKHSPYT